LQHQYIVDAYVVIEQSRLKILRLNKKNFARIFIKAFKTPLLQPTGDSSAAAIGQRIILPSSFTIGPRHMVQNYQDAMAICRWVGSPDAFVTFTCNP
jgi:hypothetical protein